MKFIDPIKLLSKIEFDKHGNITTTMSGLRLAMGASEIEAEPVKHGEWINDNHKLKCSLCGTPIPIRKVVLRGEIMWEDNNPVNYCPNCGALMDKEEGV